MANLDPTAATTKWAQRMTAAGQQITEGVNAVTVAPGVSAAKQAQTWIAKLQQSVPKWQKNVAAVSLGDWQQAMITRGIPNISAGVTAKQGNYTAFAQKFYPYLAAGAATINNMPKASLADGINKAVAQINYNAKYAGGGGRTS
jgi:hypothetical protein